ncbi:MAG TPA: TolC family protein, partial [Desulfurivibrionaceae bacterium]|nr:TolC family protein [Desulfurivibrionaceae bacterium]
MAAEPGQPDAQLEQLLAAALADNPELKSDQARWESFREKIRQAGTFDDPMLMLRLQNLLIRDPLAFDRDGTSAKVIGISQMVPFFGKRGLAKEAAVQEAEATRLGLEERKLELAAMVKESWYQLLFIDRYLEIIEKNIVILDDLSRYSETMYGLGKGQQQEVLKAQLERTRMEEMRITLAQKRRSLVASLNSLAYRPVNEPITPAVPLALTPLALTGAELEQMAEENRPLLKIAAARAQKARAMRGLAARELYPDFTFSFE